MSEVNGDPGCPSQWRTREFGPRIFDRYSERGHSIAADHAYRSTEKLCRRYSASSVYYAEKSVT